MKIILLACFITSAISFPFAGEIDIGKVTQNMARKNNMIDIQVISLWFNKGDWDKNAFLTHQEIYAILHTYSGSSISTCHRIAALIIKTGDTNGDRQLDMFELSGAFNSFARAG